ncbi:MAG: PTS sugar transporter subunit IIA [Solobacterium sp.]|nr:PTS sugar transporter subunit IIA [Solobacterium sp.]
MIGIIVTGHGRLPSGMVSAVNLIAGKPKYFIGIDYAQEDTADDLEYNLKTALRELKDCDGVLIFTDMVDAAPYLTAVHLKEKMKDSYALEVISGCNLGMLVQTNMARGYVQDLAALASMAVDEGRKQVMLYEYEDNGE